jgi:hypothetical protein
MNIQEYQHVVGSTAEEFAATGLHFSQHFVWSVLKMNNMYSLPVNDFPTLDGLGESPVKRVQGFLTTLKQEMDEGLEIMGTMQIREDFQLPVASRVLSRSEASVMKYFVSLGIEDKRVAKLVPEVWSWLLHTASHEVYEDGTTELDRQILVMLADWLGDMNVYNRSEALKYGLPLESVLACIMGSNFTKLGADGLPIINENGKIVKGPNFMPPEAHIYATLFGSADLTVEYSNKLAEAENLTAIAGAVLADPMADIFASLDDGGDLDYDETDDGDLNDPEFEQE